MTKLILFNFLIKVNASLNVVYFKYLGSMLTNDGRCTCETKSKIGMAKAVFDKKRVLFTSTLDLKLRKKLVNSTFGALLYMVLKLGRFGQ